MFLFFGSSPKVAEYCETRLAELRRLSRGWWIKNEVYDMYSVVVGVHVMSI